MIPGPRAPTTQAEDDRALVLAQDFEPAQHERHQDGHCGPCTKHGCSFQRLSGRARRARVTFESPRDSLSQRGSVSPS